MARVIISFSLNGAAVDARTNNEKILNTFQTFLGPRSLRKIGTSMWEGAMTPKQAGAIVQQLLSGVGDVGELDHFSVHIDGSDQPLRDRG